MNSMMLVIIYRIGYGKDVTEFVLLRSILLK